MWKRAAWTFCKVSLFTFYGRKSYRFRTTWGLKVIDDKFLFHVNDPFKWKVSRVGLCVISGHLSFQQILRCFSIPYCLSPTAAVHCGRHLAGCSRDCCPIWPLQLPFVPTNKSNSDYVIVCLPCLLPLIQILTLLLSSLSFIISLSFPPSPECMIALYHQSHRVDFPETHHTTPVQQYTPESSVTVLLWPSGPVSIIPVP